MADEGADEDDGAADDDGADGVGVDGDVVGDDVGGEGVDEGVDDGDALGDVVGDGDLVGVGDGDVVGGDVVADGVGVGVGVEGAPVRRDADGDGDGVGAELVGDVAELRRALGVGAAGMVGAAEFLAALGVLLRTPADPVRTCRAPLRPETPSMVPTACGAPLLLRAPLPEARGDGAAEPPGAEAAIPGMKPGQMNASSSSAANSPAPAVAAG